jgi:AcrR family transcriptional regulator
VSSGSAQNVGAAADGAARGADTRAEILAATERLLEGGSLHELSVADIIDQAGVSRATFYFYFSSKYALIAGLLTQIMDDVYGVARPFLERADDESPYDALSNGISAAAALWKAHRPAMRAMSEHWPTDPELGELWLGIVDRFTDALAAEVDRQRKQGFAPPGPHSRELIATLLWTAERCFYVAGLGVDEGMRSEEQAAEVLIALWRGAIYGGLPGEQAARKARR